MANGGGAGGYNIPVSISDATAQNPTVSFTAGTVFNFGSGAARGDMQTIENTTDQRPTATSSAANGPSQAVTDIGQDKAKETNPAIAIGIVVAAVAAFAIYKFA